MSEVLPILCGGVALIIVLVLIILNLRSFSYSRKDDGNSTCITITAKRNLERITLIVPLGKETLKFERKRIRKGVSVDFVFPRSKKQAKLIVEAESGHAQELWV
ncbi:hypothetical protein HZC07_04255 [Candidatus Micrarchaeota archaeon]|nr:hypothetical protein [Candidatus Micrarchaeota archaeon]